MTRVCVAGITGWTGGPVAEAIAAAEDLELVGGVSRSSAGTRLAALDVPVFASVREAIEAVAADVVVDYTNAAAVKENVLAALSLEVAVVVGSTGLTAADFDQIDVRAREARVGVIAAGNFSLLAALLLRSAAETARHVGSWEIVDYASAAKPDVPSGTARELAERLATVREPTLERAVDTLEGPHRHAARPSPVRRSTPSVFPASSSRRRSSLRPPESGWCSATTRERARRRTWPGRCSRFAPSATASG